MKEIAERCSFPIAVFRGGWLEMGIVFTAMPLAVYYILLSSSYSDAPVAIITPILILFVCGFGYFLLNGLGMLLYCVGRIEVDMEEIRVKLGLLTLRRVSLRNIRAVVYAEQGFGKTNTQFHQLLVLSTEEPEQIEKKGNRKINKGFNLWEQLVSRGMKLGRPETAAYARYTSNLPLMVLGLGKGLAFGWTAERTEMMRRFLRGAKFYI